MRIHLISGFLGQANDWDHFKEELSQTHSGIEFSVSTLSEDISKLNLDSKIDAFTLWAQSKVTELKQIKPDVVIAYSMGGRLFSHIDVSQITSLKKAIFISNHWGIENESDKVGRVQKDIVWSDRFSHWPWGAIMREWNSQTVFSSDVKRPDRNEKNYDREVLAKILSHWTLGKQGQRDSIVKAWKIDKFWIHGEKDALYSRLAARSESIGCKVLKVLKAGHSPHITHPRELAELIHRENII